MGQLGMVGDGTARPIALRKAGLTWRVIDGEVVVLDLVSSRYFSINGSGSRLWSLLDRGSTGPDLVEEMQRVYGLDRERAGTDVRTFLETLDSFDLLSSGGAPGGP